MKKIMIAMAAFCLMCACSGEREYLNFHGKSMGMSAKAMVDSLVAEGLAVDTHATSETQIVLADTVKQNYMVTVYQHNDTIQDILEAFTATYNDSTSALWQTLHDQLQKELDIWPGMTHRADLHKEAVFDTDKGTIVLTLLNTYSPTLSVRYSTQLDHK